MKEDSILFFGLLQISVGTVVDCVHSGILRTHFSPTANVETATKEVAIHTIIQKSEVYVRLQNKFRLQAIDFTHDLSILFPFHAFEIY